MSDCAKRHPWEDLLSSLLFELAERQHDAHLERGGSLDPEDMVITPEVAAADVRLDSAVRAAAAGAPVESWELTHGGRHSHV